MLRLIIFLVAAWMVISFVVRATRFLGQTNRNRRADLQRRQHPEDYAKKARVIDIESSSDQNPT